MRNAEDSPNHGLSGRMQTPDKRTNSNGSPANTPTNQHHDYEEDIVGFHFHNEHALLAILAILQTERKQMFYNI